MFFSLSTPGDMVRAPCYSKVGLHRGPWTANEDALLTKYVQANGEGNWRSVPQKAGLLRCGKSGRLRWMNYLRPDIKRGDIEPEEEDLIIRLHAPLGNKWSLIAGLLPGRTDNEIKNYWNTHLSKKLKRLQTENNNTNVVAEPSNIQEPQQPPKTNKHSKIRNRKMQKSKIKMEDMATKTERKIDVTPKAIRNFGNSGAENVINDLDLDGKLVYGSSSLGGGDAAVAGAGLDFAWPGFTHTKVLIYENDHSLDFPHLSQIPTKDAMLEKIYREYLQLLVTDQKPVQLDPFQESVWA